jgi:branched-chain amino acid transport system permease protein
MSWTLPSAPAAVTSAGLALLVVALLSVQDSYGIRLLTVAGVYALSAIGFQFVFGHVGALSLAQATFLGVGAYATGLLSIELGWPAELTLPASVLVPVALAALIAIPVLRLEGEYFALATLGIGQVMILWAVSWESLTGGANGLPGVPTVVLLGWQIARGKPLLLLVWSFVGITALAAWFVQRGLYGRAMRAVRDCTPAAQSVGIDPARLRFAAFLISAGTAGLAGAFLAHATRVVSPEYLGFAVMVGMVTIVVVGGRTRIAGAILGALLIVHLPEWFRFLDQYYLIAFGAATILALVLAPEGVAGSIETWLRRLHPPRSPSIVPVSHEIAARPTHQGGPLLEAHGITKSFGGVRALDEVRLTVASGEILGVIGPNGSGKTTLINVITGFYAADAGSVRFDGTDVTSLRAQQRAQRGLARTFQTAELVSELPAIDNVAIACGWRHGFGLLQALATGPENKPLHTARAQARSLLDQLGAAEVAWRPAGELPYGLKRRVEIARALGIAPKLLVLDEPAAGLTTTEQVDLRERLRGFAQRGLTIIVIEHNMAFLMPLAARIMCLENGSLLAQGTPAEIRDDRRVVEAYLGTSMLSEVAE